MNRPPSANMFVIRAPFPRDIGTEFSGILESLGSTKGRVHPHVAYVWSKETSP
jgi:hypothetical protein